MEITLTRDPAPQHQHKFHHSSRHLSTITIIPLSPPFALVSKMSASKSSTATARTLIRSLLSINSTSHIYTLSSNAQTHERLHENNTQSIQLIGKLVDSLVNHHRQEIRVCGKGDSHLLRIRRQGKTGRVVGRQVDEKGYPSDLRMEERLEQRIRQRRRSSRRKQTHGTA